MDRLYEFPETKFTSACAVYYQWIEVDNENVILFVVKQKKDGAGTLVRMYKINREDSSAKISLFGQTIPVYVPHNGLVTVDEGANTLDAMKWNRI